MVVLFVGIDHQEVAVELVRVHLLRFLHFRGDALDLALLLLNELSDLFLELFLFTVQAAVRGLVFTEVGLDELEVAPRVLREAVQFQGEDDFLAFDGVDIGAGDIRQALAELFDRAAPGEAVCRRQFADGRRHGEARVEGQFVEDDRAHAVEALQHPRLQRFVRAGCHHFRQLLGREGEWVHAHEIRREGIRFMRRNRAQGLLVLARLDQGFDDCPVFREDDVAVFAHQFDVDLARHQAARHVEDVDVDVDETVQVQLGDGGDAAVFIILAQEHAEPRRDVRRRRHRLGDVQARRIVEGNDQMMDARIIEDAEIKGTGIELINLGNLAALQNIGQLIRNTM